ncbi:MAG TPA: hypothetical protein VF155_08285 [Candidatus Dormibacteraeota bacterium]
MTLAEQELELETLVELPQRLETTTFYSPITATITQSAWALNAAALGGSQAATVSNVGTFTLTVS